MPSADTPIDNPTRKLMAWKDALIDLSRRNPLLSLPTRSVFRLLEPPDELWKLSAAGKTRLWFLTEKIPGTEIVRELKTRERACSAADFKTLNNLRLKARLSLSEQGMNVLFLVVGVLEWFDPRIGAAVRSPLLLLPVTLERLPGGEAIVLARYEEDPRVNPTLMHRLARPDIGIALPEANFDEDDFRPSAYLARVAEAVAAKPNWRVVTDECVIGRFSYLNLVMYEELDKRLEEARRHPVIAAIAGDADAAARLFAPDGDAPLLDTEPPQMAYHVLPADPSQERAILAARSGQSLVIQGPPGTGKTQTIANLIATLIADGKSVLFVSEKMAALEAVYSRLHACGLGELCLEAHSNKAKKQEILAQIRTALEAKPVEATARPADWSVLAGLRDDFNGGVAALHEIRQPLGRSVYQARGIVAELAGAPDVFFALSGVETVDADTCQAMERLSERLAAYTDLFGRADTHPWRGLHAASYSQELYLRLRDTIGELLRVSDALEARTNTLWRLFGLPDRASAELRRGDADFLVAAARRLEECAPDTPSIWLRDTNEASIAALRSLAVATGERVRRFQTGRAALDEIFTPDLRTLPHAELIDRLAARPAATLSAAFGEKWDERPDAALAAAGTVLSTAVEAMQRLVSAAAPLAELTGFDVPVPQASATLASVRLLVMRVQAALDVPQPAPAWFAPETVGALRSRAAQTRDRQQEEARHLASLGVYDLESLFGLDLNGLATRFRQEYASVLRYVKPAFYADQKTLQTALQPGASLAGRDVAADLEHARAARDLRQSLKAEEEDLRLVFGAHFQAGATHWDALLAALDKMQALKDLVGNIDDVGSVVPSPLRGILLGGLAGRDALAEQAALVRTQGDAAGAALREAERIVRIAAAQSRPLAQVPVDILVAEFRALGDALTDFADARRVVARTVRGSGETATRDLIDALRRAQMSVAEETAIEGEATDLRRKFAGLFDGWNTNWTAVADALERADRLRRVFAEAGHALSAPIISAVSGESGNGSGLTTAAALGGAGEIDALLPDLDRLWHDLSLLFAPHFLTVEATQAALPLAPFTLQREWAEERLTALSQLERWMGFEAVRAQCEALGLLSFVEVVVRRQPPAEQIPGIFQKAFHQRWLEALGAAHPELAPLGAAEYRTRQPRYERLDRGLIAANPKRIRSIARQRRELIHGGNAIARVGERATIQRYLQQQRPRASVRKILGDIPNLLLRLKPCLMMSPLSVSLYLDPEKIQFNVVVFDEASQIFPEYALGPLLRADQAVIAGDSKQLPPSSFFKEMQDGALEDSDEDDEAVQASDAREFESILDAASVPLAETTLNWHYRSHHESLIGFSREHFYQNLQTFPSVRLASSVHFEYVPDGVYYGGKDAARNNPVEAVRVADLVEAQIRREPGLSVGVITMSEAQQECLRAEFDRRTSLDSTLASLLDEDKPGGFFVKNIENVQGDERDVIFLSVGYGKWPDGRARMLFGPINRDGGERRLNVAVTRARQKMTLVSSLLPEEIILSETTKQGPRLLRGYLAYARTAAGAAMPGVDRAGADEFVESLAQALEARRHIVRRLIGLSDYRVDIAIVDPREPETFLLGIACDGASYRSGETARAREWLRKSVMTGLGWRLHRVWSGDFLRDREGVLNALDIALAAALAGEPELVPAVVSETEMPEPIETISDKNAAVETPAASTAPATSDGLLPGLNYYVDAANLTLPGGMTTLYGDMKGDALHRAELIDKIVTVEGPVHIDVVAGRLCRAAGLTQTGTKIRRIADDTVALLTQAQRVDKRGDFLWRTGVSSVPARVPRPGENPRPVAHVCAEEIAEVALVALRFAIGMHIEEAVGETARLLGYERTGPNIRERIEAAIASLEIDSRIHNFNGQLRTFDE